MLRVLVIRPCCARHMGPEKFYCQRFFFHCTAPSERKVYPVWIKVQIIAGAKARTATQTKTDLGCRPTTERLPLHRRNYLERRCKGLTMNLPLGVLKCKNTSYTVSLMLALRLKIERCIAVTRREQVGIEKRQTPRFTHGSIQLIDTAKLTRR